MEKWGCHWLKEREHGEAFHFVNKVYKKLPFQPYTLGNAVVPSRAEVLGMYWNSEQANNEVLEAVDLSSHYASVMISENFPTGM